MPRLTISCGRIAQQPSLDINHRVGVLIAALLQHLHHHLLHSIVVVRHHVPLVPLGGQLDLEVLDAAVADPLHLLLGLFVVDHPQPLDVLLGALAHGRTTQVLHVLNSPPLQLRNLEVLLVRAVFDDLAHQNFPRLSLSSEHFIIIIHHTFKFALC